MKYKFFLRREPWGFGTELFARCRFGEGDQIGLIEGSTVRMVDVNKRVEEEPRPLVSFRDDESHEALQALMDELWNFGIRPSDIGTAGHLAATTKHLEDMRAIAFGQLGQEKP